MNDEEINEIIARSDGEVEIFRQMDIQRVRDQKNAWQLAGRGGPPPQPLIQIEELPECYQNDEPFEGKDVEEELEGRGHRKRAVVSYNDGLDDDAWAMVRHGLSPLSHELRSFLGARGRRGCARCHAKERRQVAATRRQ